jgi:hypothetical protein
MEKRNIIENGRTPQQSTKQADDNLTKVASSFERGTDKDKEKPKDGKSTG